MANAVHQPVVAARPCSKTAGYDRLPYFFTDQYDLGMDYTGYTEPDGHDEVVIRGDTANRDFIAFRVNSGRLTAAMDVNVWEATEPVRQPIRSGARVSADRLIDLDVPLTHSTLG